MFQIIAQLLGVVVRNDWIFIHLEKKKSEKRVKVKKIKIHELKSIDLLPIQIDEKKVQQIGEKKCSSERGVEQVCQQQRGMRKNLTKMMGYFDRKKSLKKISPKWASSGPYPNY